MSKMARLAGSQADAEIVRTTSAKGLAALRKGLGLSTALAAVLALAAVILCHGLTEPFIGHHDWTSASMSAAARNHLRYGYTATRLLPTFTVYTLAQDPGSSVSLIDSPPSCLVIRRYVQYHWKEPVGARAPSR